MLYLHTADGGAYPINLDEHTTPVADGRCRPPQDARDVDKVFAQAFNATLDKHPGITPTELMALCDKAFNCGWETGVDDEAEAWATTGQGME